VWLVIFGIIFYAFLQQCFRPQAAAAPYPQPPPPQAPDYGFNDGTGCKLAVRSPPIILMFWPLISLFSPHTPG